jgi:hypothetical protein
MSIEKRIERLESTQPPRPWPGQLTVFRNGETVDVIETDSKGKRKEYTVPADKEPQHPNKQIIS